MALQTFTAGQVLTAAQVTALQTNDFNQTVSTKTASHTLVAADKGTRVEMNSASATTITVNTSLFDAGDTLFIQNIGAGVCTITAGTATVATAGSLALAQNAGGTLYFTSAGVSIFFPTVASSGASGLTFISTATFTTASTISLANNTFNTNEYAYRILIQVTAKSTSNFLIARLRAAGTDSTASSYDSQVVRGAGASVAANIFNSSTSFSLSGGIDRDTAEMYTLDVINPNQVANTFISGIAYVTDSGANQNTSAFAGRFEATTQFDSLSFITNTGTVTGKFSVFKYAT